MIKHPKGPFLTNVTQPSLPPLSDFIPFLEKIWSSRNLTNCGPFHAKLEIELCSYLGVDNISLFANGTLALLAAVNLLDLKGEVITTPYSFVATAHAISWAGLKPVFVDIDQHTLNIDPHKIEAAITEKTTAILAVHVYGHPCDVDAIQEIADRRGLKVIYDAAHAFGVKCHCGSLLKHGDLSVLSFHATKVFNTFEGGALVSSSPEHKKRIDQLKNFGFLNEVSVSEIGVNGKMSEFNAALGLLQLNHIDNYIKRRKEVDFAYRKELRDIKGIRCHVSPESQVHNYNYFPIFVENEFALTRDELYERLKAKGINCRKYFYPLISDFAPYKCLPSSSPTGLPNASKVAQSVLCLPIHSELTQENVREICKELSFL